MATTYITNDEWAVRQNYADFSTFALTNEFPIAATITGYRDDANAIINEEIGVTANISLHASYLKRLEYNMVIMMLNDEHARQNQLPAPQFIPKDYLYKRDRDKLKSFNTTKFNRGVSH